MRLCRLILMCGSVYLFYYFFSLTIFKNNYFMLNQLHIKYLQYVTNVFDNSFDCHFFMETENFQTYFIFILYKGVDLTNPLGGNNLFS